MNEPCPPHLDDDGKSLWEQCSWILGGGAVHPSTHLQVTALSVRRELRMESEIHDLHSRRDELETALLLTVSWLKKFQDRFDELGDSAFGTFAYGHRQKVEEVLKRLRTA
jgi:hypothetical protein